VYVHICTDPSVMLLPFKYCFQQNKVKVNVKTSSGPFYSLLVSDKLVEVIISLYSDCVFCDCIFTLSPTSAYFSTLTA
jgi:hypothetical protein